MSYLLNCSGLDSTVSQSIGNGYKLSVCLSNNGSVLHRRNNACTERQKDSSLRAIVASPCLEMTTAVHMGVSTTSPTDRCKGTGTNNDGVEGNHFIFRDRFDVIMVVRGTPNMTILFFEN